MKFRKKPVVIEAFQMTLERRNDNSDWPEWLHRAWNTSYGEAGALFPAKFHFHIEGEELAIYTLEGVHLVSHGDWIIQGLKGEIYPCKPDIFEASYEAVEN